MGKPMQHPSTRDMAKAVPEGFSYSGKLIIFTSFYDFRAHAPYMQSMMALAMMLEKAGVKWDFWPVFGDFHIERCVNEVYTRFLQDEEATDILCIDSDESFDPAGVFRLLGYEEEIVAGAYLMKNNWKSWTGIWLVNEDNGLPIGRILPDGTALLQAFRVPWGFMRAKRSALEKYRDAYPDLWFKGSHGKVIIFCQLSYLNNELFSQDFAFSERLKNIGVKLWIDPNITIGHWGNTEYLGNLDTHLKTLRHTQDAAKQVSDTLKLSPDESKAYAMVAQMAQEIEQRNAA